MPTRRLSSVQTIILPSVILLLLSAGARADQDTRSKPQEWDQQLERLRAVPYISYSKASVDKSEAGVVFYNPERAYQGYNFYATMATGEAFLMDMNGHVIHRWIHSLKRISGEDHAVMLENGDLVVLKNLQELFRLNWDSEFIWKRTLPVHHDVVQAFDGSFYVIVQELKEHRGLRAKFDAIVHVNSEGEEIDRWSTYEHLGEIRNVLDTRFFLDTILDSVLGGWSPKGHQLDAVKAAKRPGHHRYDYFHMNTVSVLSTTFLEERNPRFREGNLLVCFRNVNQIAVLDKDTYRILWAWGEGELQWPHHPTMLDNGHILIFDNGVRRKYSRVVELDPLTQAIVWEYVAQPPEDFFSFSRGSAQRLPNGNTLICESDNGRVFEVTQGGEVVWTWLNPSTREWRRDGRRETVYRMSRLPSNQVDKLLRGWGLWWE